MGLGWSTEVLCNKIILMKHRIFISLFLSPAKEYIDGLLPSDQGTIAANIEVMREGDFESVNTKQLKGQVRELIVGNHRLTYFGISNILYFVRGFRKKSRKTPLKEIEYAEKIYKATKEIKK